MRTYLVIVFPIKVPRIMIFVWLCLTYKSRGWEDVTQNCGAPGGTGGPIHPRGESCFTGPCFVTEPRTPGSGALRGASKSEQLYLSRLERKIQLLASSI